MPRLEPLGGVAAPPAHAVYEDFDAPSLPREHPPWVRDAAAVSQRAKALLARLQPVAVRVMTFWDHAVRSLRIGNASLTVDTSGSYRLL